MEHPVEASIRSLFWKCTGDGMNRALIHSAGSGEGGGRFPRVRVAEEDKWGLLSASERKRRRAAGPWPALSL